MPLRPARIDARHADPTPAWRESLGEIVADHARRRPDAIAFRFEGRATSYGAFDREVNRIAHALAAAGVTVGGRIAYLGKNTTAYFALLIGASRIGAVTVPVNWRLAAPEVAHILTDAGASLLFVGAEFETLARAAAPAGLRLIAAENDIAGLETLAAFAEGWSETPPAHRARFDDALVQLYTSGTTGLPKGVVLPHRALLQQRYEVRAAGVDWGCWSEDDVSLLAMPVFHVSGTGWANYGLFAGAESVIVREFDPDRVLDLIETHKVSQLFLVPAALKILMDDPRSAAADFSHIRGIGYGSSPIADDLLRRAMDRMGPIFTQHYGLTETTGSVLALPTTDHAPPGNPRLRSCGRTIVGSEARIVDPDGRPVAPGTPGEIQIRSSCTMLYYWNQPEATAKALAPDGWLSTGDAAWMDEDGYVFILDRIKDMIISGGENIYPAEVENAIMGHPAVDDVAVIGVPDDRWGEAVRAVVVVRAGMAPDAASIGQWARARIAGYKVPKSFAFVDALPRNPSGKVLRRELRAEAWAHHDRQVN